MEFFVVFCQKGQRFYQRFLENTKGSFKKNIDMLNIFFSIFCDLIFGFLFFLLFWTFYFQFRPFVLVKKFQKFLYFSILWIRDFIKEFWKIMECFSKKYRDLKSKILHKFYCLLFIFFYFFSILVIFFSYFTYPNLAKNSKHFCGCLLYGLQNLSENSGKFLNFY